MSETWKDIPGFEGRYQVSRGGRVRSLDRYITQSNGKGATLTRQMKGKTLTPQAFSNGYLGMYLGRGSRCFLVHRLVAQAFVPGDSSLQVNHKNGKRDDNRAANLEWLSCSDNHLHSYRELPRKKHGLTIPVMVGGKRFASILDAANYLGVVAGSVASALHGNRRCRGLEVQRVGN